MAGKNKKKKKFDGTLIADNRRARYDFAIDETVEAGVTLLGTEVKSLRNGKANIAESYAAPEGDELMIYNLHIPEYTAGNRFNHEPRRPRKLLMHRREIDKMIVGVQRAGMTIVPLKIYFNNRGKVKVEVALAKGKNVRDKRDTERNRDWSREKSRLLKEHS